jgi:2-iminobutanoate/2-iminopropanoate deaminase
MKKVISTKNAPQAIGPYSQAVVVDGILYSSGQIGLKPDGELIGDDVSSQTKQVLENLKAVLAEAGATLNDVIKTTIFLDNMDDFGVVNGIYEEYFGSNRPARSTVAVKTLPKNVKIEIDCIAKVPN